MCLQKKTACLVVSVLALWPWGEASPASSRLLQGPYCVQSSLDSMGPQWCLLVPRELPKGSHTDLGQAHCGPMHPPYVLKCNPKFYVSFYQEPGRVVCLRQGLAM